MSNENRLRPEIWGVPLAIYGCCLGIVAFVCFRMWRAFEGDEITMGRNAEWLLHRVEDPFWFWLAIAMHAMVATAALVMMVLFSNEMRHVPNKRIQRLSQFLRR